ncbi:MAG: calcium/sodium antiporter [Methanotrichaceae archaeon]
MTQIDGIADEDGQLLEFFIFALSLVSLYYGAKFITDSAVHFAKVLGVSEFVIGATIVAFGTSLPELSASLIAMLEGSGHPEIVVGNVLGSNVANIGLALGSAAMFYRIYIDRNIIETDLPFLLASVLAMFVAFIDFRITWFEGLFMILMYLSFICHEISQHQKNDVKSNERFKPKYIVVFVTGMVLLYLGAKYMILSILAIAVTFSLSETIISFILVALGTSLPEMSTSIIAAKDGRGDIAVGDIIGSNAFNALIIPGVSSLVGNVVVNEAFMSVALPVVVLISFLLGFMMLGNKITKFEGMMLVIIYFITIVNML